jgi:hypothetical protein
MSAAPNQNQRDQFDNLLDQSLRSGMDWSNVSIFDHVEPSTVISEAIVGHTQHIIQSNHPHFIQDLNATARLTCDNDALIKNPLATILAPEKKDAVTEQQFSFYECDFNESGQKSEVLSQIDSVLVKKGISDSIRADALIIADELVTNAIYNAPFVDLENTTSGAPRNAHNVKMRDGKSAHLWLGGDGQRIVIGCRDDFGTLNFLKFLGRVKNCYEAGVASTMRMSGRGGAGIGTFMIFNSSASLFIDIKVGVHTGLYCTLPTKMSSRARIEMPKNLHFRIQK